MNNPAFDILGGAANMRDLLFKNLTSQNGSRKVISSSEVMDKQGIRSVISRHFICIVREVKDKRDKQLTPSVHIVKERNSKEHKERFFCKIKGGVYAVNKDKLYLVLFMHSLKINLIKIEQGSVTRN